MAQSFSKSALPPSLSAYLLRWPGSRSIFSRRRENNLLAVLRQLTTFSQSNAPLVPGLNACIAEASGLNAARRPTWSKRRVIFWLFLVAVAIPLNIFAAFTLYEPFHVSEEEIFVAVGVVVVEIPVFAFFLLRRWRRRNNVVLSEKVQSTERPESPATAQTTLGRLITIALITIGVALYNFAVVFCALLGESELVGVGIGLALLEAVVLLLLLGNGAPDFLARLRLRYQLKMLGHAIPTGQVAIYMALRERLQGGQQLSEAMAGMHRFFPAQVAGQLRAAEASGRVAECLRQLADDVTARAKARRKAPVQRAYLSLVVLLGLLICSFLMFKVLPVFREIHEEFGSELPASMKLIIGIGDYLLYRWPHVITCAALALVLYLLLTRRVTFVKRYLSRISLRLPFFGPATRYRNATRAAQVLHELVRAEVPLPEALQTTARAGLAPAFADTFARWKVRAETGATLSECAQSGGAMPRGFADLARLGEHADALPEAMGHAASMYGALADRAESLQRTLSYPIALAPVAFLVYWITAAFYETIAGMSDALFYSL